MFQNPLRPKTAGSLGTSLRGRALEAVGARPDEAGVASAEARPVDRRSTARGATRAA